MIPIIQITPPKIKKEYKISGKKGDTKGSIIIIYDYDESHLIYNLEDLGSMKELSTYKKRIDKAIEYIEDNKIYAEIEDYGKNGDDYVEVDELLSILKGEDKKDEN